MLKIDIRSLSNGVHDLSFTPSPEEIEVSEDKFTDLKLDVRLDIASRRLYVRVKIAATAALVCDRTSVDYTLPVKGFFSVVFVPPEELDGDEERDDLFPLLQGAEDIDLKRRCTPAKTELQPAPTHLIEHADFFRQSQRVV